MSNPTVLRRHSFSTVIVLATGVIPSTAFAIEPFTDASASLNNGEVSSGAPMAVADMNGDGLDDIVRLDQGVAVEIEYQQADGTFMHQGGFALPGDGAWGMAIADIDNNGYPDIFAGGAYDGLKLLLANDDGTSYSLDSLVGPDIFVQCVSFADINTDGAVDLFICHDDGLSSVYEGAGDGSLSYNVDLLRAETTIPSDDSGNYGTTFTDYDLDGDLDLYIAKCRLFISDPDAGERRNLLFENDGDNNFVDVAVARGVSPPAQSWTADFADIDNDNDFDAFLTTHVSAPLADHQASTLYENIDNEYVDITAGSGMVADIEDIDIGIQTHFEDFDNDGFVDLLITGASGEHRLFMNNGDRTFTAADDPFPTGGPGIQSAVVGEFNGDGFPDIVAGFATGYNSPSNVEDKLFLNAGNENHWLDVRLTGVESNRSAVGAMVELHGEWGVQRREVRAGESYGIVNSLTRHFGIGEAMAIDSVVINWPSGHVDTVVAPGIDQTIHITEGCPDTFYADTDGDGFGDPGAPMGACIAPEGHVVDSTDCDDADGANFPGNEEVCDGADNDCDTEVDEELEDCDPGTTSTGGDTGDDATTMPADTSGDSASDASATDPTDDNGDADESESSGGTAGETEGGGCGCTTERPADRAWWLVALLLPALRRRRDR
jgi:MYXO-CTERM domain-containing protein